MFFLRNTSNPLEEESLSEDESFRGKNNIIQGYAFKGGSSFKKALEE